MHNRENKSFIYMLIFTAVSSLLAYHIVVKAYDGIIVDNYDVQISTLK